MKRYIFSLFLLFAMCITYGQKNIGFIQIEVEKVETDLVRNSEHLKLNNIQKEQLHVIFEAKFKRVDEIISRNLSKLETSKQITLVEKEFHPQISEILNIQQRIVFQKKKKIHTSDSK
jgi:hypothetical protein